MTSFVLCYSGAAATTGIEWTTGYEDHPSTHDCCLLRLSPHVNVDHFSSTDCDHHRCVHAVAVRPFHRPVSLLTMYAAVVVAVCPRPSVSSRHFYARQ